MIDTCFNPTCRRELHYLREGRVVRVIHGKGQDATVEHFWLCGHCYEHLDFAFPAAGGISIEAKPHLRLGKVQFGDVLLPS